MRTLLKKFRDFLRQCGGPTAVEYAVLFLLIIFGALTAISLLGTNLRTTITSTAQALPSGADGEDSSELSKGDEDEDEKSGRGGRGRGGRGRGGRISALPLSSSGTVRYA